MGKQSFAFFLLTKFSNNSIIRYMEKLKRIPYGVTDFKRIQRENYYYVDKTKHFPILEKFSDYTFLIRPRRFGKSLWLSVLDCYYDINRADEFDTTFKNTWIKDNPTEEKSSYLMLKFNFSAVNPNIDDVERSFYSYLEDCIYEFNSSYKDLLKKEYFEKIEKIKTSIDKIRYIFRYSKKNNLRIFVIIDEYDNFTNTILTNYGNMSYEKITHAEGFYRYFFNILKEGTTGTDSSISKLFITGVSPVTMDDVTSGFNIGTNITTEQPFEEITGFTEEEVKEMVNYYYNNDGLDLTYEELQPILSEWYNNYVFSKNHKKKLYNSDMILYYINRAVVLGSPPDNLIDMNVKTDYKKLRHLLILDKKLNGNFSQLKTLMDEGEISSNIVSSFPVAELTYPENFTSLLYFLGIITIDRVDGGRVVFKIPNNTIKSIYSSYLIEGYKDADVFKLNIFTFSNLMQRMAYKAEWKPLIEFIADNMKTQLTIRDFIDGEAALRGFLTAYFNLSGFYIIKPEYEFNKGFIDIFFKPHLHIYKDLPYSYLLELKYIKRSEYTKKTEKAKLKEAKVQLLKYSKDKRITESIGNTKLIKLAAIFNGWELVCLEEI